MAAWQGCSERLARCDRLFYARAPMRTPESSFEDIVAARLSRRDVLQGSLGLAALSFLGCGPAPSAAPPVTATPSAVPPPAPPEPLLGFSPIPISRSNQLAVPPGYKA